MNRFLTFQRLGVLFVLTFGLLALGAVAFQRFQVEPEQRCATKGQWWYEEERRCVTPIYLPDITGRPEGVTRAQASDQKNRELLQIERNLAEQRAARDAEVERQRQALAAQ